MKNFVAWLAILVGLCFAAPASAQVLSKEVLVGSTSTQITRTDRAVSVSIQNLGPDPLFCAINTPAVVNKSHRIQAFDPAMPADSWVFDMPSGVKVFCITANAQSTGAATIIDEAIK